MRHFVIHALNVMCLAIVLIGVPAATSVRLGSLQIGSRPAVELVTLGMITVAFLGNLLGWLIVSKKRRERHNWIRWSFVHLILLAFQMAHFEGFIGFAWLKESLLWLKSHL